MGEVSERVQGNDGRMDLPTLTISAGKGWLDQRERFSNNIAGKEQENYTLLSKGQLSYNKGNSKLAKYGVAFELRTHDEALVPKVYHSFKATPKSNASFLEYMFGTKIPDNELAKLITSGARMDGLLNIGFEAFMGINICIPVLFEQTAIGNFFRTLDDTITLHKHKLDGLKELKKGYLQQMFPQSGECVPRVRFEGFIEPWEVRKLGELLIKNQEKNKANVITNVQSVSNKFGFVNQDEYFEDRQIASKDTSNYYVIRHNAFAYNPSRINVGSIAIKWDYENSIVSPLYISFYTKDMLDNLFLWNWFKTTKFEQNRQFSTAGGVRDTLSWEALIEMEISTPSLLEQTAIGNFLRNLDEQIATQQTKLNKLKQLKTAYLQKMFV